MTDMKNEIKLFEEKKIADALGRGRRKMVFPIIDVIEILSGAKKRRK